jgi:hypothetical protein
MRISLGGMIRRGFLSAEERKELVWLARDGSAEHRVGRRANAILLLDDGLSHASLSVLPQSKIVMGGKRFVFTTCTQSLSRKNIERASQANQRGS